MSGLFCFCDVCTSFSLLVGNTEKKTLLDFLYYLGFCAKICSTICTVLLFLGYVRVIKGLYIGLCLCDGGRHLEGDLPRMP